MGKCEVSHSSLPKKVCTATVVSPVCLFQPWWILLLKVAQYVLTKAHHRQMEPLKRDPCGTRRSGLQANTANVHLHAWCLSPDTNYSQS